MHHDTAAALADAGFVVAAISHPRDNFQDKSGQGHLSIYATRPADTKRLVDYMLGTWVGKAAPDPSRVGLFGFSMGGYTGLVSVGAVPDFHLIDGLCAPAVIVDPLSIVFDADHLKTMTLPIQLWASAFGGDGIVARDVEALHHALPVEREWHLVQNATHFAFVAPCTLPMANALPEICNDRPGFDRVAFHGDFNAQVVAFFGQHLGSPEKHLWALHGLRLQQATRRRGAALRWSSCRPRPPRRP